VRAAVVVVEAATDLEAGGEEEAGEGRVSQAVGRSGAIKIFGAEEDE